jgi:hypothetical protein
VDQNDYEAAEDGDYGHQLDTVPVLLMKLCHILMNSWTDFQLPVENGQNARGEDDSAAPQSAQDPLHRIRKVKNGRYHLCRLQMWSTTVKCEGHHFVYLGHN